MNRIQIARAKRLGYFVAGMLYASAAAAQVKCTTQTLEQGGSPKAPTVKVCK